jgi:hypothetical protein
MDDPKTWIAIYAAIVATSALFLNIRTWFEVQPRLRIRLIPDGLVIGGGPEHDEKDLIIVNVTNLEKDADPNYKSPPVGDARMVVTVAAPPHSVLGDPQSRFERLSVQYPIPSGGKSRMERGCYTTADFTLALARHTAQDHFSGSSRDRNRTGQV